jgi:predicted O-methyltransferase YrrM
VSGRPDKASAEWQRWNAVDEFVDETIVGEDEALVLAREDSDRAGLPGIAVTPAQGKLLYLLTRVHSARRVLELGTLGGYSTIWIARGLAAGGLLVTVEIEERYAEVAARNIERAGVADRVRQRLGPAAEHLGALSAEGSEPFDLVFMDADKPGTPEYLELVLPLVRPGSLIVSDNTVRAGELGRADTADAGAQGMRRMHELLAAARERGTLTATTIQTVGGKGYDGFTVILVEG